MQQMKHSPPPTDKPMLLRIERDAGKLLKAEAARRGMTMQALLCQLVRENCPTPKKGGHK